MKAGGEGYDREWDGWMPLPTQWTRIWANSGRWWRTGKPGMPQSMRSQTVRHDWATEQQYSLQNNKLENKIHPTEGNKRKKIVLNTDRGKGFGDWIHNIYVVKKSQAKIL